MTCIHNDQARFAAALHHAGVQTMMIRRLLEAGVFTFEKLAQQHADAMLRWKRVGTAGYTSLHEALKRRGWPYPIHNVTITSREGWTTNYQMPDISQGVAPTECFLCASEAGGVA